MDRARPVIVDRREEAKEQKEARRRVMRRIVRGELPSFEDSAAARGLTVRERQNSIFSDAWMPLALIFLIAGFAAGRNVAMLALGIVLVVIYGVSTWWKDNALAGVGYRRDFDRTRVFPGEPIEMTIHVRNDKPLPLTWLRVKDRVPVAPLEEGDIAEITGETHGSFRLKNAFALGGRSRLQRTFTFAFPRRGYYTLGPVEVDSGDIFTLFTIEREYNIRDTLIVYPTIWPLEALALPAKEPFGELKVQRSLFTDPIKTRGIRDYHPHDRFRDVHWKASARRGNLQTKVYEPSTGMTLAIFLNVATMRRHWMGYSPEQLERAVSVAASVANYAAEQKWGVGLYVNGSVPRSDQPIRVPPGRAPEQLSHVLEALAATREFATGAIENLMQRESPRLPWAATLVLVTAHVSEEMAVVLLRLKEAGRRVVLISLAEEAPPTLPNVLTYHVPPDAPAFREGAGARGDTEAALSAIPTPEAVGVVGEDERPGGDGTGDDAG